MKNIILGIIIGMLIGVPLAWAAASITLEDNDGTEFGTSSNPIVIQLI